VTSGWTSTIDPTTNREYFFNHMLNKSQWLRPEYVPALPEDMAYSAGGASGAKIPQALHQQMMMLAYQEQVAQKGM